PLVTATVLAGATPVLAYPLLFWATLLAVTWEGTRAAGARGCGRKGIRSAVFSERDPHAPGRPRLCAAGRVSRRFRPSAASRPTGSTAPRRAPPVRNQRSGDLGPLGLPDPLLDAVLGVGIPARVVGRLW